MKRVLFITFRKTYNKFDFSHHAIIEVTNSVQMNTIIGYIKQFNNNFDLIGLEIFYVWPDIIDNVSNYIEYIKDYNPDIICVSLLNVDFLVYQLIRQIIEINITKRIVWVAGGYMPTSQPKITMLKGRFDFIVVGHGEYSLLYLLEYLTNNEGSLYKCPNLFWKDNSKFIQNNIDNFTNTTDNLKLNFEPFNYKFYIKESWQLPSISNMKYLTTWFSRGCVYDCGFCLNKAMNQGRILVREPECVIEEIIEMNNTYGINYIFFADENFLVNIKETKKLLELMIKYKISKFAHFTFMTSINNIFRANNDFMSLLKESGCEEIQYGVESGSQLVLNRMNKRNLYDECLEVFDKTFKNGMMSAAMLILGFEGETLQTLSETKDFIYMIKPDRLTLSFLVPSPKTTLGNTYYNDNIPLHLYNSDFPTYITKSLEKELIDYNLKDDLVNKYNQIFKTNGLHISNSQSFLMRYRNSIASDYYNSNIFFQKQKDIFDMRINKFNENKTAILEAAMQWFKIIENSILSENYSNSILNNLIGRKINGK